MSNSSADTFRAKADPAATALRPERTSTLRIGRTAHVTIPAGALYEPLFVRPEIRTAPEAPEGVVVLSPAYRFLDCTTPLRLAATAEIRADIPRPLQLRTLLAVRNRHGRLSPAGGRCNNDIVRAATLVHPLVPRRLRAQRGLVVVVEQQPSLGISICLCRLLRRATRTEPRAALRRPPQQPHAAPVEPPVAQVAADEER